MIVSQRHSWVPISGGKHIDLVALGEDLLLEMWYFTVDSRRRLHSGLNRRLNPGLNRRLNRGLKRRPIMILIGGARCFICVISLDFGCENIAGCEHFRNSIIVCSPICSIGADVINCVRLFWFLRWSFLLRRRRRAQRPPI